ncbi:MAG: nuclear transport factor 2 family protein [Saprospiraceae bacterium]
MNKTLTLILFLLPLAAEAQSKADQNILATEERRFEAMVRRDTILLRRLLADDLIYLHSNALQEDKTAHIVAIVSGKLIYEKMVREQANVRQYGRTALVNGTVVVTGKLNDAPFQARLLYSAVYRKKCGKWQLVSWQSTRKG